MKKLFKFLAKNLPVNSLRVGLLRACGFQIGHDVYVGEDLIIAEILEDSSPKLIIGDRVAIGPRVTLVTSSDANKSVLVSTAFPPIRGRIVIGSDAWLGAGSIVLPNVSIGERAVVGAGAVVTKDVPPDAVVVGVPAHPIELEHEAPIREEATYT